MTRVGVVTQRRPQDLSWCTARRAGQGGADVEITTLRSAEEISHAAYDPAVSGLGCPVADRRAWRWTPRWLTPHVNAIALLVLYGIWRDSDLFFEAALLIAVLGFTVGTVAVANTMLRETSSNDWRTPEPVAGNHRLGVPPGGSAFVLIGAIGLHRLPDLFMRLHGRQGHHPRGSAG